MRKELQEIEIGKFKFIKFKIKTNQAEDKTLKLTLVTSTEEKALKILDLA